MRTFLIILTLATLIPPVVYLSVKLGRLAWLNAEKKWKQLNNLED